MRKSELFARYDNFGKDIIEISKEEFLEQLNIADKENSSWVQGDSNTECFIIRTDGMDYMQYSSLFSVGWQGDKDCDQFFCKIQTITKKEMEEISAIFNN